MMRKRTMSGGGVIDLSMVDNAGRRRSAMTTANCYLVHKTGQYKLPLVYGNAIKDGQVNTVAFNPGGTTTSTYLNCFQNHNGNNITAPWITKSSSGSGVDKGMGLTASSAELLWQDAQELIESVSISDDGHYLCFNVGTYTGGNALLGIKDSSDNIMWSWHIWATNETLDNTTRIATGSHNYDVAPVNVGWVSTNSNGKQGYCPYYQWGRKEPFKPAAAYDSNTNHTLYKIDGTTTTAFDYRNITSSIGFSIQQPTQFIYSSSTYGYCNKGYYNLWDANNTSTENVTTATVKTVYDPCPPDFVIPTGNLAYYMGNTGGSSTDYSTYDSTNKGRTWIYGGSDLWIPFSGDRKYSDGNLESVGSFGYFQVATPYNDKQNRYLNANSGALQWSYYRRAYGRPVRPVKEE